ncbi:MAG: DUF2062 domain-containing protein [Planctomycetota bacterium]
MRRYIYRQFIQRVAQINDTPESIALGATLGMFIAMTPTVGIQMILIVILNTIVRANRLAGVVMVYVSNPITMIPIYWVDYIVGVKLVGQGEALDREHFTAVFEEFADHAGKWDWLAALSSLNTAVIVPTCVGGVFLGILCAIPVYPFTLRLVRGHQRRKAHRQALIALRDARRVERAEAAAKEAAARADTARDAAASVDATAEPEGDDSRGRAAETD